MNFVTPVIAGVLLALFTAIQTWINKGRFDAIERRLDAHDRRFDQVVSEIAQLRSDLLQVVLALTPRQQTG